MPLNNDAEFNYLRSLGFVGSLNDMRFAFYIKYPGVNIEVQMAIAGGPGTGYQPGLDTGAVITVIGQTVTGSDHISVQAAGNVVQITTDATVNSSDTYLLDRANQTGKQSSDTIFDGTTKTYVDEQIAAVTSATGIAYYEFPPGNTLPLTRPNGSPLQHNDAIDYAP